MHLNKKTFPVSTLLKPLLALGLAALVSSPAQANILCSDNFEGGAPGANIVGTGGGIGWIQDSKWVWGAGGGTAVLSPMATSAGQQLVITPTKGTTRVNRTLAAPLESGTAYISILMDNANDGGRYMGLSLFNTQNKETLSVGQRHKPGYWGFWSNANLVQSNVSSLGTDTLTRLVLRVDFDANGTRDKVSLYVNPALGSPEPTTAAAAAELDDIGSLRTIGLGSGFQTGPLSTTISRYGQLCIADTWADLQSLTAIDDEPPPPGFENGLPGVGTTAKPTPPVAPPAPVKTEYVAQRPSEAKWPFFPFVNLNPGPQYADSARMYQGLPSIAKAPNGRLWTFWFGGGECEGMDNYVMLATSDDDGKTWSPLKMVIDIPKVRVGEPMAWVDPNGKLWLCWTTYPLRTSKRDWEYYKELTGEDRSLKKYSHDTNSAADQLWIMTCDNPGDENPDWSAPRLLFWGMTCGNKPMVMEDGTWLWPSFSLNKDLPSRPLLSSDDGETFTCGGPLNAPNHPYCDEYNVVQLDDGSLLMLNRTPYGIAKSTSTDGGQTWSEMVPSGIPHPSARQLLIKLNSGNLLLIKHGPLDQVTSREQLTAYISRDEGDRWEGGLVFDERTGVSYPDGFQDKDGLIYVAYDHNRYHSPEVLMATFTEEDVLAGKDVSGQVRLKQLINKATSLNTRY